MALESRINQLLALDENKKCADCGTRQPRWASYSLGIFVCLQCAGFHRSLGVHISRVKSCDLDRWTEDQVRAMESMGNATGREEYGPSYAEVNNTTSLPDAHALDTFIRSKYVRRLYAKGGFGASFNTPTWNGTTMGDKEKEEIRIDWPRKPAAAAAGAAVEKEYTFKPQKQESLIDLFEPTPVVQQVAAAAPGAAPIDPFFADFATPEAAAAVQPNKVPALAPVQPLQQQQQQSFAVFPALQQMTQSQPRQSLQQPQLGFDDDFGDFVVAATAATKQTTQPVQQVQHKQPKSLSLFGDDFENMPPALPAKDYNNLLDAPPALPARDYAAPATRPSAPVAVDALAGLFATSPTLAPAAAAALDARPLAPSASVSPRMTTADIMALYGGGGGQPTHTNNFVATFGGPGASWA